MPGVYVGRGRPDAIAPLSITVPPNTRYYVKLLRSGDKHLTMSMLVTHTLETKVPLGGYELVFATGEAWYGPKLRFGAKTTHFSKADRMLDFYKTPDGYRGLRIELFKQIGGNLKDAAICEAEFGEE